MLTYYYDLFSWDVHILYIIIVYNCNVDNYY